MSLPRLARLCLLTCLALSAGWLQADDMRDGSAFVKGLSGSLTADGRSLSKHETFDPVGKTIVSGPNGHSCVVFSNRLALVLEPDTTLVVRAFQQALPDGSAQDSDNVELGRTQIDLKLERGGFAFAQVNPRATSSLTLELPLFTLSGRVSEMLVSLESVPPEVAVIDGNLRVHREQARDLIVQSGQWLDLGSATNLSLREMLKPLDVQHTQAVQTYTEVARSNYELVHFTPTENGWQPQVRILKASGQNTAKNDYLIRN